MYKIPIGVLIGIALIFTSTRPVYAQQDSQQNLVWQKTGVSSTYISSVKTTPWGVLAGENDARLWKHPYNGIYITKNIGSSWTKLGLEKRGVTDIDYSDNNIWASTYFFEEGTAGAFLSTDGGKTWQHKGSSFSAAKIAVLDQTVFVGGYSHGLWVSFDNGQTWEQKIGDGFYGPEIFALEAFNDIVLASTETKTYKSLDGGLTWEQIEDLEGLIVSGFAKDNNTIITGTKNTDGMYKSTDLGKTFNKIESWGNVSVGDLSYYWFTDMFYAGRFNNESNSYDLYQSSNAGTTWEATNLELPFNEGHLKSIDWLFSSPSYIFAAVPFDGIYRLSIPHTNVPAFPFLRIPWETQEPGDLIDTITSYFDHSYPLLGYSHHTEPPQEQSTTLNYLGIRETRPKLYYSSHDAIDFGIPLYTNVLAAADGIANYAFDAKGLGHYIRINHQNGFQTTYAHLVGNPFAPQTSKNVKKGEIIGQIGLSGNTTGPHLHFSVKKSKQDEEINNNIPDQKIDPFGWQNMFYNDPWANYEWLDNLGTHSGSRSFYLWENSYDSGAFYISPEITELQNKNKKVLIQENAYEKNFTVFIEPYPQPHFPIEQNKLTYISGTSFLINAYNNLGQEVPSFIRPMKFEIDFSNADLSNIKENTLNIYYWNESLQLWEKIPTIVDYVNKIALGETNHFSKFALLAEKTDFLPPETQISIQGNIEKQKYVQFPLITLTSNDIDYQSDIQAIYYSINAGKTWETYQEPFYIDTNGRHELLYRAVDIANNWENLKSQTIDIQVEHLKAKLKIKQASFGSN